MQRLELSPREVRAYTYASHYWAMLSSLGVCHLQMEGWDPETGWPTFAKLAELGIEWAARLGACW
jgi:hypothetical protein